MQRQMRAVLYFWFEETDPQKWFDKDADFDAEIAQRFHGLYDQIVANEKEHWRDCAEGCLAEILVLDQFSRNMFRGSAKAYAADEQARACLAHALDRGFDKDLTQTQRIFLYLPLEHSEDAGDQARVVDLMRANGDEDSLHYAIQHKAIIDRFGRFPHRNAVLGRASTPEEEEFLKQPGSSF